MRTVRLGLEREVKANPEGPPSNPRPCAIPEKTGCSRWVTGLGGGLEASEVNLHMESPIPNPRGRD